MDIIIKIYTFVYYSYKKNCNYKHLIPLTNVLIVSIKTYLRFTSAVKNYQI